MPGSSANGPLATINSLGFDEVLICDPHSDVTQALVENIRVIPQVELVTEHEALCKHLVPGKTVIVAPGLAVFGK